MRGLHVDFKAAWQHSHTIQEELGMSLKNTTFIYCPHLKVMKEMNLATTFAEVTVACALKPNQLEIGQYD